MIENASHSTCCFSDCETTKASRTTTITKKKKKDGGSKGNVHSPGDNFKKMTENILITSAQHTLFSE